MSSDEQITCEILSWNRIARDAKRLASLVKESGYKIDIAVAIARGGLVPARILSEYLHIRDLTTIKVEHWGITATPSEKAVIKFPLCVDIKDRNVLLIDDTTDTGDTLRVSIEYLKSFKLRDIRTATLIHKTCSEVTPDYFVRKVMKWKWIIFPWHVWEDLTEFVRRIADSGIHNDEDIKRKLEDQYHIKVKIDTVREVLLEVTKTG